ncbi:hypothetical protein FB45DRAFT_885800 [Roridomyces roridus]|uniref:C2H2-type domain-containing protein n=1 Tax=Roridomyces roridus TaxID=1738132 RepID=A0AAD7CI03_9AGAR|nr:hypothetical protein FB45DRAFT_885800 [Roridomyces roridus]
MFFSPINPAATSNAAFLPDEQLVHSTQAFIATPELSLVYSFDDFIDDDHNGLLSYGPPLFPEQDEFVPFNHFPELRVPPSTPDDPTGLGLMGWGLNDHNTDNWLYNPPGLQSTYAPTNSGFEELESDIALHRGVYNPTPGTLQVPPRSRSVDFISTRRALDGTTYLDPRVVATDAARIRRKRPAAHFKCTRCDATFTSSHNLKRHENAHDGIRPYPCQQGCGQHFTTPSTAARHSRSCRGNLLNAQGAGMQHTSATLGAQLVASA